MTSEHKGVKKYPKFAGTKHRFCGKRGPRGGEGKQIPKLCGRHI